MKGQGTKRENIFVACVTINGLDLVHYEEFLQIAKKETDGIMAKHARILNQQKKIHISVNMRKTFQYY